MQLFNILIVLTLLFCLAIGFDLTPYLRGPAPYFPDWRWEYYFVNTSGKILLPVVITFAILAFFLFVEKRKQFTQNHSKRFFFILILLSFIFQLSVLSFSRSGVPVLLHRIIHPDHNGYFTAALDVENIPHFLETFDKGVLQFPMHAQGHPPGAILFFYGITTLFSCFPFVAQVVSQLTPTHGDILMVWKTLSAAQQASAIFSGFFISFLSTLTLLPLYYGTKFLYGVKTAIRAAFLYVFLPNVVLFIPINDVFLPLFAISTLFFFLKGVFTDRYFWLLFAGVVFSLGLFFSLSLLPLCLFYFLLFLFYGRKQQRLFTLSYLRLGVSFLVGLLVLPIFLFLFFQFNSIEVGMILMSGLPEERAYLTWVFYNLYDFFVFSGIPVAFVFLVLCGRFIKSFLLHGSVRVPMIFFAFAIMLFILDISGSVRGEVGRIWLPFMPFMAIIAAHFLTTERKFTTKMFAVVLLLQAVQILVMQEFWVMLW